MKRINHRGVHLLFILLGLILLSACGAEENTSASQASPAQTAAEATKDVETSNATAATATASAAADEHGEQPGVEPAPTATESSSHGASSSAPAHTDGHPATKAADGGTNTPAATPEKTPASTKTPPTAVPSQAPEHIASPDQAAQEHIVEIIDFVFSPSTLEIKEGDRVKFVNKDEVRHSATADDGSFDTGLFGLDEAETIEFSEAGEFGYYCLPHPAMRGTIIVTAH